MTIYDPLEIREEFGETVPLREIEKACAIAETHLKAFENLIAHKRREATIDGVTYWLYKTDTFIIEFYSKSAKTWQVIGELYIGKNPHPIMERR